MAGRGKRVDDSEILKVFITGEDPVYSAAQVSSQINIGKNATDKRLRTLEDQGFLASKKIGPGRAWWITDQGTEANTE